MHITLIGFMGSGKTTVGKKVSQLTGLPFFDLDEVVESLEERSVSEIFAAEGEEYFRQYEHQILLELLHSPNSSIIACGGGTPCYHNAMTPLNQLAKTIYLQTPAALLYQRLHHTIAQRPVLQNQSDVEKYILELLYQREVTYKKAHWTIDTAQLPADDIAKKIVSKLALST